MQSAASVQQDFSEDSVTEEAVRPRFRENVWWVNSAEPSGMLCTAQNSYEVPIADALAFLAIRPHCTGHNSMEEIARRSGRSNEEVSKILDIFRQTGIFYPEDAPTQVGSATVKERFLAAIELWKGEMAYAFPGRLLVTGKFSPDLLTGFLLEAYHEAISFYGTLRELKQFGEVSMQKTLASCTAEHAGYSEALLTCLINLGFLVNEIKTSVPLPSTRLIHLLMNELLAQEPSACFLVISLMAARRFHENERDYLVKYLSMEPAPVNRALDPYFSYHDRRMNYFHTTLFAQHADLFHVAELSRLDSITNKAHDLIHACLLQTQEIKSYYTTRSGDYIPRQKVGFYSL